MIRDTRGWRPGRVVAVAVAITGTGALLLPLARAGRELADVAASISPGLSELLDAPPARVALVALWVLAAVGATLLVLLALTVTHMLVVLWLDRRHVPPPDSPTPGTAQRTAAR